MPWRSLLIALLFLVLLFPVRSAPAAGKDWTILVYMDADNNLEQQGIADFLEMSSVGSTSAINIIVQMDRTPGYDATYGDWTTTRRFYVTRGMTPATGSELSDLGEINMADPSNLTAFVNWGIASYPANHYFVVLWDHGLGWQGVVADDDPVSGDRLTALELRTAASAVTAANGRRIDLLGNDACRMTLEIDYELADFVDYFVGSEKDEPLEGWPYDMLLGALAADPTMSPPELASVLVDEYVASYENTSLYSVALSAVSAAALRPFVADLNAFLAELTVHEPYFTQQVVAARDATEHYEIGGGPGGLEYDLYNFVENLLGRIPSRRLERSADALYGEFGAAVVHERHWDNPDPYNQVHALHAHGLSLFFPAGGGGAQYGQLAFSLDSAWDEFLLSYAAGSRPQVASNASAAAEDVNNDGLSDGIALQFRPAIDGTMWVDGYRDGAYAFSRQYATGANRTDVIHLPLSVGGSYEVTFYLLQGSELVNLTVVPDRIVEQLVSFHGKVLGSNGAPLVGATVTLTDARNGQSVAVATARDGQYVIRVVYPTWFRQGDPMLLEVTAGERKATVVFNATIGPDGSIAQDVRLDTLSIGWLYTLAGILVLVAAVGVALALYYRQRLRKYTKIP